MPKNVKFLFLLLSLIFPVLVSFAGNQFVDDKNTFLSVDEAFKILRVDEVDNQRLEIYMDIADGYYLYKSKFKIIHPEKLSHDIIYPEGMTKNDEYFGEQEVFYESIRLLIKFNSELLNKDDIQLKFQGCSEKGLCYPPTIRYLGYKNQDSEKISSSIQNNFVEQNFKKNNIFLILFGFLISGLLLSITPCVLPMVPVLSGIIMASNQKSSKLLTISYVMGICVTYSALGIIAGITGTLFSSSIQNIGFLYFSGILFLVFGLIMLEIISIKLPINTNNYIANFLSRFRGGNTISVFFMGLFSALILSPCVAPPLAAAILYIGQTSDFVLGGVSLLFMAIGMSVPLLILGFSSDYILPKPGIWMNFVKKIMGFVLLAMAAYITRPLLPEIMFFISLLTILFFAFVYSLKQYQLTYKKNNVITFSILFIYILSAVLLTKNIITQHTFTDNKKQLVFMNVEDKKDLDIKLAISNQKPQMLDFYADWCVACLEYEKYTFTDEKVYSMLKNFNLLKADVTENNIHHKDLMQAFNIFGPPGIMFFDKNGNHLKKFDIIGFKNAEEFYSILEEVNKNDK
jgi:thiol:disulfide interchange protein DsbD